MSCEIQKVWQQRSEHPRCHQRHFGVLCSLGPGQHSKYWWRFPGPKHCLTSSTSKSALAARRISQTAPNCKSLTLSASYHATDPKPWTPNRRNFVADCQNVQDAWVDALSLARDLCARWQRRKWALLHFHSWPLPEHLAQVQWHQSNNSWRNRCVLAECWRTRVNDGLLDRVRIGKAFENLPANKYQQLWSWF